MSPDLTHKPNKLNQWNTLFIDTVAPRGSFCVLIVTWKALGHASVFDALGENKSENWLEHLSNRITTLWQPSTSSAS